MSESSYWERTDTFEEKIKMLQAAWQRKDYRLARALGHSLRNTAIQAQVEGEPLTGGPNLRRETTDRLPSAWRTWAQPWRHFQVVALDETIGLQRPPEPVELTLRVPLEHASSLAREVRVARVAGGQLREVPCQVYGEVRRQQERQCKLLILASGPAHQRQTYLIFLATRTPSCRIFPPIWKRVARVTRWTSRTTFFVRLFRARWGSWRN